MPTIAVPARTSGAGQMAEARPPPRLGTRPCPGHLAVVAKRSKNSLALLFPVVEAILEFDERRNFQPVALAASVPRNWKKMFHRHQKVVRASSRRAALIRHGYLQADTKHCLRAEGH